jgi:hypothetical protein
MGFDSIIKYNHYTELSEFDDDLKILREHGYSPIAVSQLYFEFTFVFNTKEEATRAYRQFERDKDECWIGEIASWWYSKKDFLKKVEKYESDKEYKVKIYWL